MGLMQKETTTPSGLVVIKTPEPKIGNRAWRRLTKSKKNINRVKKAQRVR